MPVETLKTQLASRILLYLSIIIELVGSVAERVRSGSRFNSYGGFIQNATCDVGLNKTN